MKKGRMLLILSALILISGCGPKIVSIKSPMNRLEKQECFLLPSKELLSKSPIYKQKLYQLTQKTLQKHKINVIYANEGICKNYLLTDWTILASKEMVTLNGATYTNSYGNLNNDFYSSSSVYTGSSYSYATPDITYEDVSYNGTYSLEVGKLNDNDLLKVWEGSQSGSASGSSIEEAQMITDDDQSYIDDMVEQMLQENKLISIK